MGKPTGFLEYKREGISYRHPKTRISDWNEFYNEFDESQIKEQATRCMDCGTPFCHSGIMLGGFVSGCPINNLIPEWNDLIYNGRWEEAYRRLVKTNNFPEFTGRVCPAPCEGSCTLGANAPSVTIKNNEVAIIEKAFREGLVKAEAPKKRTEKKVAVIGGGPAGLACGDDLNKFGHNVTIFEKADHVGGLLMYGIPNMKLDKKIVKRRVELMKAEGVEFVLNAKVGDNYKIEKIREEFDSVVLCCGAEKPRDIQAEGRDAKGVHFAIEYLTNSTKQVISNFDKTNIIDAKDKNVVVIGGGDTGTDCVATAIRQKCKSIVQFEIMPSLPANREQNNPWPEWPRTKKVDYGQEEAIEVFGNDPREYCIMTKKFIKNNDTIQKIETVNVEWIKNKVGGCIPSEIQGTEKVWDADLVLLALGFIGPEEDLVNQLKLEQDERTNVKTKNNKYATDLDGVFCAGDMRKGQSLVVWAIKEGKEAANECNEYLGVTK